MDAVANVAIAGSFVAKVHMAAEKVSGTFIRVIREIRGLFIVYFVLHTAWKDSTVDLSQPADCPMSQDGKQRSPAHALDQQHPYPT